MSDPNRGTFSHPWPACRAVPRRSIDRRRRRGVSGHGPSEPGDRSRGRLPGPGRRGWSTDTGCRQHRLSHGFPGTGRLECGAAVVRGGGLSRAETAPRARRRQPALSAPVLGVRTRGRRDVRRRVGEAAEHLDTARLRQGLADLFPEGPGDESNWQKTAAAIAALKRFSVITGGPGTGKAAPSPGCSSSCWSRSGTPAAHPPRSAHGQGRRPHAGVAEAGPGRAGRHPAADQLPEEVHTLHRLLENGARLPVLPAQP